MKKPPVSRCYLVGVLLLVLVLAGMLLLRGGEGQNSEKATPKTQKVQVIIPKGAPYKVNRKLDLASLHITRLEHTQRPQEFVVLQGLREKTVSQVFSDKPDFRALAAEWRPMAESLLSMRDPLHPVQIDVREIRVLESGQVKVPSGSNLPYRRIRVAFQVSTESAPRVYEVGLARRRGKTGTGDDVVLVSFTRQGKNQPDDLPAFLREVALK